MKIKISNIIAFFLFHIIFINIRYLEFYNIITYIFLFVVAIFLFFLINKNILDRYKKINIILSIFCSIIIISSLVNKNHSYRGIVYSVKILEVFIFFEYVHYKASIDSIIKEFYYFTFFYCLINDITMILKPELYYQYSAYYLIGNKFTISYLHMFLIIFYLFFTEKNHKKNNLKTFCYLLWALMISIYTECSTAIVGCLFLTFLLIFKKIVCKLSNPKIVIITLLLSCSLLLFFSGILQNKFISNFIVNVLHEDISLTGRIGIYEKVFNILLPKLFLGYGYGNSYEIVMEEIGAPNTQNGLAECILDFGLFGTLILIILIYNIFYNIYKCEDSLKEYISLISGVYIFLVLAMVEITIDITFLTFLAIINIGNYKFVLKEGEKLQDVKN